jgi:hypothetical protein
MCFDDAKLARRDIYLIVVENYVVSTDLAQTVAEYDPGALVIVKTSMQAAEMALQFVEKVCLAFVEAGPARFAASALAVQVEAKGGRVVLLGDEAEASAAAAGSEGEWSILPRPFSTDQVVAHFACTARR